MGWKQLSTSTGALKQISVGNKDNVWGVNKNILTGFAIYSNTMEASLFKYLERFLK